MALQCGMFDSTTVTQVIDGFPQGNKAVNAAFFARYNKNIIGNGVLPEPLDCFKVTAHGGNMGVDIQPGDIYINGYIAFDGSASSLTFEESASAQTKYIVFRLDTTNQSITLIQTDSFIRAANIYDMAIARVDIPANATVITDGMILDLRGNSTYCGYVSKITDANYNDCLSRIEDVKLYAHPVGSIFLTVDSRNPGEYLGGTWVAWGAGRVPVGYTTDYTDFNEAEKTGGEYNHTLTVDEMPSHTHPFKWMSGGSSGLSAALLGDTVGGTDTAGSTVNSAGGSQPHNNIQPYITCYMWKRTA